MKFLTTQVLSLKKIMGGLTSAEVPDGTKNSVQTKLKENHNVDLNEEKDDKTNVQELSLPDNDVNSDSDNDANSDSDNDDNTDNDVDSDTDDECDTELKNNDLAECVANMKLDDDDDDDDDKNNDSDETTPVDDIKEKLAAAKEKEEEEDEDEGSDGSDDSEEENETEAEEDAGDSEVKDGDDAVRSQGDSEVKDGDDTVRSRAPMKGKPTNFRISDPYYTDTLQVGRSRSQNRNLRPQVLQTGGHLVAEIPAFIPEIEPRLSPRNITNSPELNLSSPALESNSESTLTENDLKFLDDWDTDEFDKFVRSFLDDQQIEQTGPEFNPAQNSSDPLQQLLDQSLQQPSALQNGSSDIFRLTEAEETQHSQLSASQDQYNMPTSNNSIIFSSQTSTNINTFVGQQLIPQERANIYTAVGQQLIPQETNINTVIGQQLIPQETTNINTVVGQQLTPQETTNINTVVEQFITQETTNINTVVGQQLIPQETTNINTSTVVRYDLTNVNTSAVGRQLPIPQELYNIPTSVQDLSNSFPVWPQQQQQPLAPPQAMHSNYFTNNSVSKNNLEIPYPQSQSRYRNPPSSSSGSSTGIPSPFSATDLSSPGSSTAPPSPAESFGSGPVKYLNISTSQQFINTDSSSLSDQGSPLKSTYMTLDDFQQIPPATPTCIASSSAQSITSFPFKLEPKSALQRLSLDKTKLEKAIGDLLKFTNEQLAAPDEDGDTKLMIMAANKERWNIESIYVILRRIKNIPGAVSMRNNQNHSALLLACIHRPEEPLVARLIAETLQSLNHDLNETYCNGNTIIHTLCKHGDQYLNVLIELLSMKDAQGNPCFQINKHNHTTGTPFHVAVRSLTQNKSCAATIAFLSSQGANLAEAERCGGLTPLHLAIRGSADPLVVQIILKAGDRQNLDLANWKDYQRDTPLHYACMRNDIPVLQQIKIVSYLIQHGAVKSAYGRQGKVPLALVAPDRKDKIREALSRKGRKS